MGYGVRHGAGRGSHHPEEIADDTVRFRGDVEGAGVGCVGHGVGWSAGYEPRFRGNVGDATVAGCAGTAGAAGDVVRIANVARVAYVTGLRTRWRVRDAALGAYGAFDSDPDGAKADRLLELADERTTFPSTSGSGSGRVGSERSGETDVVR